MFLCFFCVFLLVVCFFGLVFYLLWVLFFVFYETREILCAVGLSTMVC